MANYFFQEYIFKMKIEETDRILKKWMKAHPKYFEDERLTVTPGMMEEMLQENEIELFERMDEK